MALRPYWSGQIRLSLVTLPVQIYSAVKSSASQVDLDQIDRKTGERVHHINALEDGTRVEREDIVKGYKAPSGRYILLEQEEIDQVKLPSSDVFELKHFVDIADLPLTHLEKPYYVVPSGKGAQEIYGVIRDALKAGGKAGLGQIALRGREEFCALLPYDKGMIIETLRYAPELRDPKEFFGDIKTAKARGEYLTLAKELIEQNSGEFDPEQFEDRYHEALMELIASKKEERKPVYKVEKPGNDNVLDLMEALRSSLKTRKHATTSGKKKTTSTRKTTAHKPAAKRKRA